MRCAFVLLLWLGSFHISSAQEYLPHNLQFEIDSNQVAKGLNYYSYDSDTTGGEPLSIHVLKIDLDSIRLEVALAMDQVTGQETTSSMVKRRGALAGVNGGFSFSNDPWNIYHGDPRDFLVVDGVIVSEPYLTRSSLGIYTRDDGRQEIIIDQLQLKTTVVAHDEPQFQVTGINRIRRENDLILYTPLWGSSTLTDPDGYEIVSRQLMIRHEGEGSSLIPDDGFVLSASGTFIDTLRQLMDLDSISYFDIVHELTSLRNPHIRPKLSHTSYHTAGPALLIGGKMKKDHRDEQIRPDFASTRHPRTGVGISKDGRTLWLLVVDGRQPGLSVGMSLPEMTDFMVELGAYNAYNLDGGGSSTMVIGKQIKNSPSDHKERRRCDALLLFPRE